MGEFAATECIEDIFVCQTMGLMLLRKQPQKLAVLRQYLVAILASLPFAVAGAAVAWPSPTLPRLLNEETPASLDMSETSWVVSLLYLEEAAGALPSVYFSDKIGRKKTLLYSGVFPLISWSIILTRQTALCLYISRFLAGLQIGVINTVYPLYIREVSQIDIRESLTSLSHITLNAGIFFISIVGPFVSSTVLVSILLLLCGLFPISFHFVPESPYYMLTCGDKMKARNSLLWLRGDLNRIELEFEIDRMEKVVETDVQEEGSIRETLSTNTQRKYIVIVLIQSALDALSGVNVIQAYATITFPKTVFGILTPDVCMIILCSATFVSSFFATYVSETFHIKKIGVASYCGCCLSMGVVTIWFFMKSKTNVNVTSVDFFPFFGCLLHLTICSFFHSTSLGVINNQDFSFKLKTNLTIISTISKSVTNFVLNNVYLILGQQEGIFMNFLIYSFSSLVAAPFFAIFWMSKGTNRILQDDQDNSTEQEISKSSMSTINGIF